MQAKKLQKIKMEQNEDLAKLRAGVSLAKSCKASSVQWQTKKVKKLCMKKQYGRRRRN